MELPRGFCTLGTPSTDLSPLLQTSSSSWGFQLFTSLIRNSSSRVTDKQTSWLIFLEQTKRINNFFILKDWLIPVLSDRDVHFTYFLICTVSKYGNKTGPVWCKQTEASLKLMHNIVVFFYINTKTRLMETGIESCTTCIFTCGLIWFIYTEWLFFFFLSSCFYTDLSHVRLQQMLSTWHHLVGWSYHPSAQHVKKTKQYLVRMPPPPKKTTTTIQANKKHRHSVSLPHKKTKLTTKKHLLCVSDVFCEPYCSLLSSTDFFNPLN